VVQATYNAGVKSPSDRAEKVSLTKSQPTNAKGVPDKATTVKTQEQFYAMLESEMRKIDDFTKKMVVHITSTLSKIEKELQKNLKDKRKEHLQAEVCSDNITALCSFIVSAILSRLIWRCMCLRSLTTL
jgi:hypothetical protein